MEWGYPLQKMRGKPNGLDINSGENHMFSIINSLSLRQFLVLIALLIVGCIGGLIQCKRSNQYGKGTEFFCYFSIFFGIVLGVNKVLQAGIFDPKYARIRTVVTLILLAVYILFFLILGVVSIRKLHHK